MKIAIRGLSATGKGTVARMLAERLSIVHVDIGKIFRCFGVATLKGKEFDGVSLVMHDGKVSLCLYGDMVRNEDLNSEELAGYISECALNSSWFQRASARVNSIISNFPSLVVDGRNAGTVFLPDAQFRYELITPAEVRVHRRWTQLVQSGVSASLPEVKKQIEKRDRLDLSRKKYDFSLGKDKNLFVEIDNSSCSGPMVVVEQIINQIRAKKLPNRAH